MNNADSGDAQLRPLPTPLAGWHPLDLWIEDKRGGPLLDTPGKVGWFLRKPGVRDRLVASGTLLPGAGRRKTMVSLQFDDVVAAILAEEAA
jgi:hypothetical protein